MDSSKKAKAMRADELLNFLKNQTQDENHNSMKDTVKVDEKDDLDTASEDL